MSPASVPTPPLEVSTSVRKCCSKSAESMTPLLSKSISATSGLSATIKSRLRLYRSRSSISTSPSRSKSPRIAPPSGRKPSSMMLTSPSEITSTSRNSVEDASAGKTPTMRLLSTLTNSAATPSIKIIVLLISPKLVPPMINWLPPSAGARNGKIS